MSAYYKTRALVFKKSDLNESDRFFSVFSEEFGRLEIFGKAIRKSASKLRSGIDLFMLSEIEFIQGKNKKTLTDASALKKFSPIFSDAEKFSSAGQVAELLDSFLKGQSSDRRTFELLCDFFDLLGQGKFQKNRQMAFQYFFWNFVSLQGYQMQAEKCSACSEKLNPYNVYFSGKDGGIVCKVCAEKNSGSKKINSDIVKILRLVLARDIETVSRLKVEESSMALLSEISQKAQVAFCPEYC